MNQTGADRSAVRLPKMICQRIHQRARFLTVRWMHEQPRLFIDDDEVLVFKEDLEWNGFGRSRRFFGGEDFDRNFVARLKPYALERSLAINQRIAFGNQTANASQADLGKLCGDEFIEPRFAGADFKFKTQA